MRGSFRRRAKVSAMGWSGDQEMEPEYDFSDGVPHPYAATFAEVGPVVILEPDVAVAHLDSEAVVRLRGR